MMPICVDEICICPAMMQAIWSHLARPQNGIKTPSAKVKFDSAIIDYVYEAKLKIRELLKNPVDICEFKVAAIGIFKDCDHKFGHPSIETGKETITLLDIAAEFSKFWTEKQVQGSCNSAVTSSIKYLSGCNEAKRQSVCRKNSRRTERHLLRNRVRTLHQPRRTEDVTNSNPRVSPSPHTLFPIRHKPPSKTPRVDKSAIDATQVDLMDLLRTDSEGEPEDTDRGAILIEEYIR